jgi:hypothetical protein
MTAEPVRIASAMMKLNFEDREKIADVAGELIAVHVYRELQIKNDLAKVAGCNIIGNCSNGSCDIIGNCSSSSKDLLLRTLKNGSRS